MFGPWLVGAEEESLVVVKEGGEGESILRGRD
jgi:hypothetical protein